MADSDTVTIERHRQHVNAGMSRLAKLLGLGTEASASGAYVFDRDGNRYLDCGGYCVFLLGHCHPTVISAVKTQLEINPLSSRLMIHDEQSRAAASLARVSPEGLDYVWFAKSGAEAVEAALKIARLNGKRRIITMHGAYHGKTLGALSVSGHPLYREPYQPLLPDVDCIAFDDVDALEKKLVQYTNQCCVILEPVQSERGVVIPSSGYLKAVESLCRHHGALLIFDEISVGLGRIGHWWASNREQVVPDILLAGKALSGGVMPVSAAICSEEVFRPLNQDPMLHTSTFAANPLACVAARTTLEVIEQDGVIERSRQLGERLLRDVSKVLMHQSPHLIKEVRGLGLLLGIEFFQEGLAGEFFMELTSRHVIVSHSLNAHKVVRLTPPSVLSDADINWLLSAIHDSAGVLAARHRNFSNKEI